MIIKKIIFLIVYLILMSSCVAISEDQSILSAQLCGDLCWDNISEWEIKTEEFLQIASTQPNVIQSTVRSTALSGRGKFDKELGYRFLRIPGDEDSIIHVTARTINEKVVYLIFRGDLGLNFKEIEETIGEPNFVTSHWVDSGINVHFLNTVKGVEITKFYKSNKSEVAPDDEINYLLFFNPEYYKEFFEADFFAPDHKFYTMYKWYGYGKISDLYWPPD